MELTKVLSYKFATVSLLKLCCKLWYVFIENMHAITVLVKYLKSHVFSSTEYFTHYSLRHRQNVNTKWTEVKVSANAFR
ncbi:hypothetical protein TVAG_543520 [Trichomonas vaginalis G3]|uniref:Uncharacterized protein n=1 Tax=Trichomonas vaginalis (strain ATCC PRA-98 / G3) TaxID=412133 RepID=A2HUN8_TRIV3|nr:hypothetical protein TVAG_543520 [Trichomonas vaginalis G3]|eukprot:XP_001279809.1 hypothetical protein [Trichomonas vaginalis G3]